MKSPSLNSYLIDQFGPSEADVAGIYTILAMDFERVSAYFAPTLDDGLFPRRFGPELRQVMLFHSLVEIAASLGRVSLKRLPEHLMVFLGESKYIKLTGEILGNSLIERLKDRTAGSSVSPRYRDPTNTFDSLLFCLGAFDISASWAGRLSLKIFRQPFYQALSRPESLRALFGENASGVRLIEDRNLLMDALDHVNLVRTVRDFAGVEAYLATGLDQRSQLQRDLAQILKIMVGPASNPLPQLLVDILWLLRCASEEVRDQPNGLGRWKDEERRRTVVRPLASALLGAQVDDVSRDVCELIENSPVGVAEQQNRSLPED